MNPSEPERFGVIRNGQQKAGEVWTTALSIEDIQLIVEHPAKSPFRGCRPLAAIHLRRARQNNGVPHASDPHQPLT